MNEVMISTVLCNILVGCFCVLILSWAAVAIQTLFNDRNEEKRRVEREQREKDQAARDLEYHEKRMKFLDK
ncbi:hypothetical protein CLOSCI_03523 [[Clostridium] scindens ATCC 35704]|uniref:Uncharacterized protein n=1 Tax=Clostridium scindens (strain ATCC 35704 / DSM 5676 / VPI 13733 / 19) TaxID=411468 RepID=B0NJ44_CLOS5|nr:hypothetical protein [[Clostridium] scindens]EDS05374.1 hypothetical protein CLOSCI_03523 [[Clostridium] scindens ATCC 35704]QBF75120.1 hypothetical protein HDCHBGLK_02529 [[Clostridium] scindens ATCC 35704]QRO38280.1 hypothetical protein I6J57_06420 [[Clostridium] scindens]BDF16148.1 hypothetical protein CE91St59_14110 [[Clostridium] scindens]BDF19845.1 hypothetical protein CE91St60_14280 [[Clostridium] scindens]